MCVTGWGWVSDADARTGACEIVLTRGNRTRVRSRCQQLSIDSTVTAKQFAWVRNDLSLKSSLALSHLRCTRNTCSVSSIYRNRVLGPEVAKPGCTLQSSRRLSNIPPRPHWCSIALGCCLGKRVVSNSLGGTPFNHCWELPA